MWINPQVVVIPMRYINLKKGSPPIDRFPGLDIQHPESLRVFWIGNDMLVIPRTSAQIAILAESLPVLNPTVGTHNCCIPCLHTRPYAVLSSRRTGQTD